MREREHHIDAGRVSQLKVPIGRFAVESSVGCAVGSWSPEVYTFYGDTQTVLRKLASFEADLQNRRVFVFVVESAEGSDVAYYERGDTGRMSVRWSRGTSAAETRVAIETAILENKGVFCVGEQTKALLTKSLKLKEAEDIPAPVSAWAAFAHHLQYYADKYVRGTVFLLC